MKSPDEDLRALKVITLRGAADQLRAQADASCDPEVALLLAAMLDRRADRIAAGERDHSSISPEKL